MIYFVRERTASSNKYSEDDILQMGDFQIDNILYNVADVIFNRPLAFQWAQIVRPYHPTCFCTWMKQNPEIPAKVQTEINHIV